MTYQRSGGRTRPRSGARLRALLACGLALPAAARAETLRYALEAPEGREAAFEISIPVEHDGPLVVEGVWTGARILSFKLSGPEPGGPVARRSGPSPQRLEIDVKGATGSAGLPWTLTIRAPAGREELRGSLTITVPEPEPPAADAPGLHPEPPPRPALPAWAVARSAPDGAPSALAELFERIEAFRARTVLPDGRYAPDGCGWQTDLLRDLASHRDDLASGAGGLGDGARALLAALARAVREVEALRSSKDPIVAGPPPELSMRQRAWIALRRQRLRPLEAELDALAERLRRGGLEGFATSPWPRRFLACLTACERYFDERAVLGEDAPNRSVAEEQWDALVAAGAALEATAGQAGAP